MTTTGYDFISLCGELRREISGRKIQKPASMMPLDLPDIPESWCWTSLSSLCERVSVGHVGPTSEFFCDPPNGIPFIRSQDVRPGKLTMANIAHVVEEFHQKLKKSQLKSGDILIVRVGANRGDCCVVPEGAGSLNCANIVFARPLHPNKFLGYFFNSELGQSLLNSLTTGSAQGVLNTQSIAAIPVPVPPIHLQLKIAGILSAYDDLIENNTRRIAILEEMAQAIYREWFVNFRFPGHENVKLVDSPLGQIPEGWEACTIKDVCESTNYGFTASASQKEIGPKFLRITDIVPSTISWENVPFCEIEEFKVAKYTLEEGDVVVARTGATTGYAKRLNKRHPLSVYASYLVRLRPIKKVGKLLVGIIVESDDYKRFINANLSGAAQPQANAQVLSSFKLAVPDETIIRKFDNRVETMLDEKELLEKQNRNLRTTRDLLLPKLISGKLDVEDLDIDVGEPIEVLAEATA